jgi:hypothetical protein
MLVVAGVVRAAQAGGVQADEVVEGWPAGRSLSRRAAVSSLRSGRAFASVMPTAGGRGQGEDGAVVQGQPPEQAARGKAELPV